jgi:hypothetical protein
MHKTSKKAPTAAVSALFCTGKAIFQAFWESEKIRKWDLTEIQKSHIIACCGWGAIFAGLYNLSQFDLRFYYFVLSLVSLFIPVSPQRGGRSNLVPNQKPGHIF